MEYPKDTIFISGGAQGIDKAVETVCKLLKRKCEVFLPKINKWVGGYRERNWKIAQECDEVVCIAKRSHDKKTYCYHCGSEEHERTGGCYTARRCKKFRIVVML